MTKLKLVTKNLKNQNHKMNKLKLILVLLVAISYNSCSSDEDIVTVIENTNGFNFKGDFFPVNQAFITDTNTIDNTPSSISVVLSNVDPINTTPMSGVNYFRFKHEATDIVPGHITPILKYSLRENVNLLNSIITDGNTILGHDDPRIRNRAVSSYVIIYSISADEIELEFQFIRQDGEVINGEYKGKYLKRSN